MCALMANDANGKIRAGPGWLAWAGSALIVLGPAVFAVGLLVARGDLAGIGMFSGSQAGAGHVLVRIEFARQRNVHLR